MWFSYLVGVVELDPVEVVVVVQQRGRLGRRRVRPRQARRHQRQPAHRAEPAQHRRPARSRRRRRATSATAAGSGAAVPRGTRPRFWNGSTP